MPKKLTTEEFIAKAISIHGNKYDYSKVIYINSKTKVKIKCKIHGFFEQTPNNHLDGKGCCKCQTQNSRLTTDQFISKATQIHEDKYDYTYTTYQHSREYVSVICPIHGKFRQIADIHLKGCGCPMCDIDNRKLSLSEFINRANKIHGNKYDYSKVTYTNIKTPITIICKIHGEFNQIPHNHINGHNCPKCNQSKGETLIESILTNFGIKYETQKSFMDCRNVLPLRYDFYLPSHNTLIEFDGIQHFISSEYFGGEQKLYQIQHNDTIKNNYATSNNIKLIRFKYSDNKEYISNELSTLLKLN